MKTIYKKIVLRSIMLLMALGLVFGISSCRGDDGGESNNSGQFKPSDFKVTITDVHQDAGYSNVSITYVVKNISNKDFNAGDQYFNIKFKIKTTAGNTYHTSGGILELDAGATETGNESINLSNGEVADLNTLTHEVIEQ